MPTITITHGFASAMLELQRSPDARALVQQFVGEDSYQIVGTMPGDIAIPVDAAIARQFIRMKLVERRATRPWAWWHLWYSTRVWIISDAGKSFKVPPRKMWMDQ